MNGSTSKIINKAAIKFRVRAAELKRAYQELNHAERAAVKQDMFGFCMEIKKGAADQGGQPATPTQTRSKPAKKEVTKARKPRRVFRRAWAWILRTLRIWDYETSYKFTHHLNPENHG